MTLRFEGVSKGLSKGLSKALTCGSKHSKGFLGGYTYKKHNLSLSLKGYRGPRNPFEPFEAQVNPFADPFDNPFDTPSNFRGGA